MTPPRKAGRPNIIDEPTRTEFICPGDLIDYVYQFMRARRLGSIAEAHRQIIAEHRRLSRITSGENTVKTSQA